MFYQIHICDHRVCSLNTVFQESCLELVTSQKTVSTQMVRHAIVKVSFGTSYYVYVLLARLGSTNLYFGIL